LEATALSPILVRPVREQLEHDRLIRLLQVKLRRKYDAAINPGAEQNAPVGSGPGAVYPDLVLWSLEKGHRLQGVVEVETGESVNHLEALAQWTHLSRLRTAFHLYVPATMVEVARRLCEDNHVVASEIWSYHTIGDQVRFTLVHRSRELPPQGKAPAAPRPAAEAPPPRAAKKPAPAPASPTKTVAKSVKKAPKVKPAASAARKPRPAAAKKAPAAAKKKAAKTAKRR
jgi:hypothetical protein